MIHYLYNCYLTKENIYQGRFSRNFYWQLFKLLKYILPIYYSKLSTKSLKVSNESAIVVSLTSFSTRIQTVHLAIKSILHQSNPPKMVVLWLSKDEFKNRESDLPTQLLELKSYGLKIEFCEDLKSHTKYIYAFQNYSGYKIVTVDDDIIYPITLLKDLEDKSNEFPNCIIANRVREIVYENKQLLPYRQWKINKFKSTQPTKQLLPTGVGGVLYKSHFFSENLYDRESIQNLCLLADDIWLRSNSMIKEVAVVFTKKYYSDFIEIKESQTINLYSTNVFKVDNDKQIHLVFNKFGITEEMFK